MIGQLCATIISFLVRNKFTFWLLFLASILVLLVGIRRLHVETDIYSIFPKGKEFQQFSKVIQENNLNKQLVFSFKASQDGDENFTLLEQLSSDLEKQFPSSIGNVQAFRMVDQGALISYLQQTSVLYLDSSDYRQFDAKLESDSINAALKNVRERLSGTNAFFLGDYFSRDPLGLLSKQLQEFNIQSDSSAYTVEDGIVYSHDKKRVFLFADLLIDSKDNKSLKRFDQQLQKYKAQWAKELDFDTFGVYQIAMANAEQIQKDTLLTTIISVGLILLLLIFYYRSILIPIFFLLPAGYGILCGLGLTGFIQPEINAISIATASVLLGIVLDYAFHFYTHYKHSGDLLNTVREIGNPMIVGSFTTVAAFAALLFTDSVVLRNFGLIALCTLIGSAIFTLTALPVLLKLLRVKIKVKQTSERKRPLPRWAFRLSLIAILAFTVLSLIKAEGINFDGDLNNLSYHPSSLKKKEQSFTGINPSTQKRLYLFSQGSTDEQAKQRAEQLYKILQDGRETYEIAEIISPAPYLPSQLNIEQQSRLWQRYWDVHPDFATQLKQAALAQGFSEEAFQPFQTITKTYIVDTAMGRELIHSMGMHNLIHHSEGKHSILTSIIVSKSTVDQLKSEIRSLDGLYIMDISEIASGMMMSVKKDFDFLFYFSGFIVFLSLLVVYGRIELALFAFFPLTLAWIWILGATTFLSIEFNFVNIIIATFIFGLGDDFSIFITDGLIQQYKTNKDSISSYKAAIILSAVTTIIGTGTLYFAKHPSIHSIALISVIGITSILLITLYIQPYLFRVFITDRVSKGKSPLTFFTLIGSILLFIYFFIGSTLITGLLGLILPLPIDKLKKQRILNYTISKLAKSTLYVAFHLRKRVIDADKLLKRPAIVIANHSSFLDILAVLMVNPRTVIMVKSWVYNSPIFGPFIRYSGYIFAENGYEKNLAMIHRQLRNGNSIVIFPEGTRSKDGKINRFHKGAFWLSQKLNVPIQPLVLGGFHYVNAKNDIMINPGDLLVQVLDPIYPQEGETDKAYTKRAQTHMREAYAQLYHDHAKTHFWYPIILRNYIYKGPVLEWYVRIKYKLERANFEFYDQRIAHAKTIYDIGCGYGYLSYYLHYRNNDRTIYGIDYDEEKIATAQHAYKQNNQLQFVHADISNYSFSECDAVFFNDVLHYLPKAEQFKVLQAVVAQLSNGGTLFIRDGVVDLDDRIKNTKLTEFLSTKIFKFNQAISDLEFLRIADIKEFAEKHGMTFEMQEHSSSTSNVLFILTKANG